MATFNKMSVWPVGYFRRFSSWILRNRKSVSARMETLAAELTRIGFIKVYYRVVDDDDGGRRITEERTGFSVTPGSTLERLVQAYMVQGGNPLDISPFMMPDSTEVVSVDENGEVTLAMTYPHGGVVAPRSANYNEPLQDGVETGYGSYPGGFMEWGRYYPVRQGKAEIPANLQIAKYMRKIRDWTNQDIKERLQDLEWRIIKQMDLREQLEQERDQLLVQAFGGALAGLPELDETKFNPQLMVQNMVDDMYELLYTEVPDSFEARPETAFLDFTFEDLPEEVVRDALGG